MSDSLKTDSFQLDLYQFLDTNPPIFDQIQFTIQIQIGAHLDHMSQTENAESNQNTNEKRKKQNVESENEHASGCGCGH